MGVRELSGLDAEVLEVIQRRRRARRGAESTEAEGAFDWETFFSRSGSHGWGYFHERELLGTVFLRPDPRQPLHTVCLGLWVEEAHRGKGLGRCLTLRAIDFAETEAYQLIKLWVAETNLPACRLYKNLGFAPTGRLRAISQDPFLHLQQYALSLQTVGTRRNSVLAVPL